MAKVERLERLKAKLDALPSKIKEAARETLQKNADEYAGDLRRLLPKSKDAPHLSDAVVVQDGDHELQIQIVIGDAQTPYPAHLEWGHKARDGSKVPAQPVVYPLLRIKKKRFAGRVTRAGRKAIKELAES